MTREELEKALTEKEAHEAYIAKRKTVVLDGATWKKETDDE